MAFEEVAKCRSAGVVTESASNRARARYGRSVLVTVASGLAPKKSLENRRLGVVAEHLLQRLDDLALGGVRAGAGEQRVHQVAIRVGGVLAQRCQRALDRGAV